MSVRQRKLCKTKQIKRMDKSYEQSSFENICFLLFEQP
jgi:hypothetical protein